MLFDKIKKVRIGNSDKPVASEGSQDFKDGLGIQHYAYGLARFILQCDTPMTVGIQGEWGSGKTSLMQMVRGILKREVDERLLMYAFETWQFGALGDDELLGLHLLSNVVEQIAADNPNNGTMISRGLSLAASLKQAAALGGKAAAAGSINKLSQGYIDGKTMVDTMVNPDGQLVGHTTLVSSIQERFRSIISDIVLDANDNPTGRLVIFIDDLDRIRPERAVSMLEVLKNFMDVEHCVFVVACDYEVVRQGVRAKFGIEDEDKIRAFFDKIIQVPFQMPVEHYRLNELILDFMLARLSQGNMTKKEAKDNSSWITEQLAPMIQLATGTNPRAFKRFLNMLDLHSCVHISINNAGADHGPWDNAREVLCRSALAALQNGWPEFADYLTSYVMEDEDADIEALFRSIMSLAQDEEALDGDLLLMLKRRYGNSEQWYEHSHVRDLASFSDLFFKCLDYDGSGTLEEGEIDMLRKAASQMSLTSVAGAQSKSNWHTFRTEARKAMKQRLKDSGLAQQQTKQFIYVVRELWQERNKHDHMWMDRGGVYFRAEFTCGENKRSLVSITNSLMIRIALRKACLEKYEFPPELEQIGEKYIRESIELGAGWRMKGSQSYEFDFGAVKPGSFDHIQFTKITAKLLLDINDTIDRAESITSERVSAE